MDRETLSSYGWVVVVTIVSAVLIALATPFGSFAGTGVVSLSKGYRDAAEKIMDSDEISSQSTKWQGYLVDVSGFDGNSNIGGFRPPEEDAEESTSGLYVVPAGCRYIKGATINVDYDAMSSTLDFSDTTEYVAGQTVPAPDMRDCLICGEYLYVYNCICDFGSMSGLYAGDCTDAPSLDGWSVSLYNYSTNRSRTTADSILDEINGKPIKCLDWLFLGCSITYAPSIPSSVTSMNYTFTNCSDLERFNYAIPNGVTSMNGLFESCSSLYGEIEINANPTSFSGCFYDTVNYIYLRGSSSKLEEIASQYDNVELYTAPVHP